MTTFAAFFLALVGWIMAVGIGILLGEDEPLDLVLWATMVASVAFVLMGVAVAI